MMVKEDAKVVQELLLKDAYNSTKFKNNEIIRYTPSEVREILEKALFEKSEVLLMKNIEVFQSKNETTIPVHTDDGNLCCDACGCRIDPWQTQCEGCGRDIDWDK